MPIHSGSHRSEITQTRIVALLRSQGRAMSIAEIAEHLNVDAAHLPVNLGELESHSEVRRVGGEDGRTRYEFAPN